MAAGEGLGSRGYGVHGDVPSFSSDQSFLAACVGSWLSLVFAFVASLPSFFAWLHHSLLGSHRSHCRLMSYKLTSMPVEIFGMGAGMGAGVDGRCPEVVAGVAANHIEFINTQTRAHVDGAGHR